MPQVFKSKIDGGIMAVFVIVDAASLLLGIPLLLRSQAPVPLRILIVGCLMVGAMIPFLVVLTVSYTIDEGNLVVRGAGLRRTVPLRDIERIERTRDPRSAPALSLDRMAITYGSGQRVVISPKDRDGFLEALRAGGVAAAAPGLVS